jgi:hypothetical protein
MFWKEKKGLANIPASGKVAVTAFMILMGISYIFGFFNIYLTYSPVDQKAGLSIEDIQIAFYGGRDKTQLEKSIDGTMREYFNSDNDYASVKSWIQSGAGEKEFESAKQIFDASCVGCHAKDNPTANVVLETYKDVKQHLSRDTGKSIPRLVSLTHTHLFSVGIVIFLLAFIFSFTKFSEKIKVSIFLLAFFASAFDVGAWWLAKSSASLAPLVIMGGALLAVSFALLILLSLFDMWVRKRDS